LNRIEKIEKIRERLSNGGCSIGSWMQIPNASVAEIMGRAGYDWVVVDMEHGSISVHQLPNIFRALELGDTLPLVRLAQGEIKECKEALDAGAGGIIIPMVESASQLTSVRDACCWPPAGLRGVGFSRANLFGKSFDAYKKEAQAPFLVAMIESIQAVKELEAILAVERLDAILVGPYDFSASMNLTEDFEHPDFVNAMQRIRTLAKAARIPCGIHVVSPSRDELRIRLNEGYQFIPHSTDAVFLYTSAVCPSIN
jgi:2-dehydro-3-deoxyglucarate aldolase